jgi:ribosomal protein S18 acetylase RimI-like enzyme
MSKLTPSKAVLKMYSMEYKGEAWIDTIALKPNVLELSNIKVEPKHRGKGHASQALKLLTEFADFFGVTIELEVGGEGAGIDGDVGELIEFYQRYGFNFVDSFMARSPSQK